MAKIEIYTTTTCPFCVKAKNLLKSKGASFQEIPLSKNEDDWKNMSLRANGRRTVPQIFIDGIGIGGSDDLEALNRDGKLDTLLGLS